LHLLARLFGPIALTSESSAVTILASRLSLVALLLPPSAGMTSRLRAITKIPLSLLKVIVVALHGAVTTILFIVLVLVILWRGILLS
jgi:uncharacterized membrane protein YhaH (DUF805 family)